MPVGVGDADVVAPVEQPRHLHDEVGAHQSASEGRGELVAAARDAADAHRSTGADDAREVSPGRRVHGLEPDTAADASAITATRDYLVAFEEELGKAADGAALTEALVKRYPDNGMLIAAQIGAKVAKGEMKWG